MTQAAASVAAPLHTPADQVRVNRHHADWRGWKFMWPFALVFVFVFIIPIMYAIYISFFQKRMIGGTQFVGFANYIRLFHDQQFWSAVGRVALFTVVQVPIMLCLAAAMALALDSMKLHGTKFFRISTFLPYAVPAVVSTLIWGFMYGAKYGLVGSFNGFFGTHLDMLSPSVLLASIGNIVTWEFTGYNMLIFYSSLSTIPHSLYEPQVHQAARAQGLARDHGDLLDHRLVPAVQRAEHHAEHGPGQRDQHVLHAEHVRVQPVLRGQPVELRGRAGHHDGGHHDGDRVRGADQQHEGTDEVRPRGGRAPGPRRPGRKGDGRFHPVRSERS